MPNPHVVDEQDAPMTRAEYQEWAQGYEMWLSMCAAQEQRVMFEGGAPLTNLNNLTGSAERALCKDCKSITT